MATKSANSTVMAMLKQLVQNPIPDMQHFGEAVEIIAERYSLNCDTGSVKIFWQNGTVWVSERWS